jgi:hypothetical protein
MSIFGKTLAAFGAVLLTTMAVALPEVCTVLAPMSVDAGQVVGRNTALQTNNVELRSKIQAAGGQ